MTQNVAHTQQTEKRSVETFDENLLKLNWLCEWLCAVDFLCRYRLERRTNVHQHMAAGQLVVRRCTRVGFSSNWRRLQYLYPARSRRKLLPAKCFHFCLFRGQGSAQKFANGSSEEEIRAGGLKTLQHTGYRQGHKGREMKCD